MSARPWRGAAYLPGVREHVGRVAAFVSEASATSWATSVGAAGLVAVVWRVDALPGIDAPRVVAR